MAVRFRKNVDGEEYQHYFTSVEDIRRDVQRYRMSSAQARKLIEEIQGLLAELLGPETTDRRRAATLRAARHRAYDGAANLWLRELMAMFDRS